MIDKLYYWGNSLIPPSAEIGAKSCRIGGVWASSWMTIFRMWIAVNPSKWLSKGVCSRMCCFGVGLPYKTLHGEPTSPCGHLRQLPLPSPSLLRAWFLYGKKAVMLAGFTQNWLVNSMILLSGYSIRQSYLAMSDHGRIPKVKNRYPIVKAIFDSAIWYEIQER